MARPSTYDPNKDYEELANKYLATCGREQTKLPKISEFCREYVGADEDTVNLWIDNEKLETKDLFGAIKRIREAQKTELIDDGLFGGKEVNVAMAIFLLKANHGMVETARTELVGKDGQPLTINVKLDLAGGYIPQMGRIVTTPTGDSTGFTPVQSSGVAQASKENNDSANGDNKAGSL